MANLGMLEKQKFEDLLGMGSGYVLDFSDRTFADLFRTEVGIDIYDQKFATNGTSKAKRLRAFWELESDPIVGKLLGELLQFWLYDQEDRQLALQNAAFKDCEEVVQRLSGVSPILRTPEETFLRLKFGNLQLESLDIEPQVIEIISHRLTEATQCRDAGAHLSCIFMCGSILEGLLLGAATRNPKAFNQTFCSPKKDGKAKPFYDWKLGEFIDAACELDLITLDVKKFSHALRDFRNYIHPYQQLVSGFVPDEHTADICLQVLRAALAALLNTARQS